MNINKNFRSGETRKTRARVPKNYPLIDRMIIRSSRAFTGAIDWIGDQPFIVLLGYVLFGYVLFKAIPLPF